MKIRWKKVFYFVFLLGSMLGFKDALGQNDSLIIKELDKHKKQTISGHISYNETKSPLPFCNVILLNTNNDTIKIVQTDFNGYFEFDFIPKGLYKIKITFISYLPYETDFFEVGKDLELNFVCYYQSVNERMVVCYIMSGEPKKKNFEVEFELDLGNRTYLYYNIDGRNWNKRPKKLK